MLRERVRNMLDSLTIDSIEETLLRETIGNIVKKIRMGKKMTQGEVCRKSGVSQSQLSRIENAQSEHVDINIVKKILGACGEKLVISSTYDDPIRLTDETEQEDLILTKFAEGKIAEANKELNRLRRWYYPDFSIVGQCKRSVALAVSYHFDGREERSKWRMQKLVEGLSLLQCQTEMELFQDMYFRVIQQGEEELKKAK